MLILNSCSWFKWKTEEQDISQGKPNTPSIVQQKDNVADAANSIGVVATDVGKRAENINDHTTQIQIKSSEQQKQVIKGELDGIKTETQGLKEDQSKLIAAEQKLKQTEIQLDEQQKTIDKYTAYTKNSEDEINRLNEKVKSLEESNAKLLKTMMSWIAVASVVGIGACLAIGFFLKTPKAFLVAGGFAVTLGIAVAVSLYLHYIAWVALAVLGLGCIGVIVYVAFEFKDRDVAVNELVETGEAIKTHVPEHLRKKIFGTIDQAGVAHLIQSDKTINIVRKVRNKKKQQQNLQSQQKTI